MQRRHPVLVRRAVLKMQRTQQPVAHCLADVAAAAAVVWTRAVHPVAEPPAAVRPAEVHPAAMRPPCRRLPLAVIAPQENDRVRSVKRIDPTKFELSARLGQPA